MSSLSNHTDTDIAEETMTNILNLTPEFIADYNLKNNMITQAERGNLKAEGVMEFLKLSPNLLKLANANAETRAQVLGMIKMRIEGERFKLARDVVKQLGRGAAALLGRGDHGPVSRFMLTAQAFPNFSLTPEPIEKAIEADGLALLDFETYRNSPELELLQRTYGSKVRLTFPELGEKANAELPEDFLAIGPVDQEMVLKLIEALGGTISESRRMANVRGVRIAISDRGYVLNDRAEVRASLMITRFGSAMLDAHQAMFVMLCGADAGLTRAVTEGGISRNFWDSHFQGWIFAAMAKLVKFEGFSFEDEAREYIVDAKFQPAVFAWGLYGLELDMTAKLSKAETARKIFAVEPLAVAEPQAKCFYKAVNILDVFREDDELLAAVGSICPTKWIKRILLDKAGQMELISMDTSPVTFKGHKSQGRELSIAFAPTLLPEFSGGLGAIPSLRLREVMAEMLAFKLPSVVHGSSAQIKTEEDWDKLRASLPVVGDTLAKGHLVEAFNSPLPIKVKQAGIVVDVELLQDDFRTVHWTVKLSKDENRAQAKLRGAIKGMLCFPGVVRMVPFAEPPHRDIRGNDLIVSGIAGDILVGMDANKGTAKGNAEYKVRLAAATLRHVWGADAWETKIRELVDEDALTVLDGVTYVDFSPLKDVNGAYNALVAEFEMIAQRTIWVTRRLPKTDWEALAAQYGADLDGLEPFTDTHANGEPITGSWVGVNIGTGLGNTPDALVFTRYEAEEHDVLEGADALYYISQQTVAYEAREIVKVESTPVSKAVTVVGSMLEVAHAAAATKQMPNFVAMMHEEGMKRAVALEHLLRLMTLREDENGELTVSVAGATRVTLNDPELPWSRVIRLDSQTVPALNELEKAELLGFAGKDVDLWDDSVLFVCKDRNGYYVAFDAVMLRSFAKGTEINGTLATVRDLLGYAAQGSWDSFSGLAIKLRMGLSGLTDGSRLFKRLHKGADAVSAKRVAVFARTEADHRRVFINPNGSIAKALAKLFGCEIEELEGKVVAKYRAPQFMLVGLVIVFDKRIGKDEIGVTSRVAALDQGDFDGDGVYLIALKTQAVVDEVMAFDSFAYAAEVHKLGTTAEDPWLASNAFEADKAAWAQSRIKKMSEIHELGVNSIIHQTQDMPSDANRAHLWLVESSFGLPDGWTGTNAEAQALMFYVYETQLAGFDPKWREAHAILEKPESRETGVTRESKLKEFVEYVTQNCKLTPELAQVFFRAYEAHRTYLGVESKKTRLERDQFGRLVIRNVVREGAPATERSAIVWHILAGAVKRLAQGACSMKRFSRLLRDLPNLVVESVTAEYAPESEEPIYRPFVLANGNAEVFDLMEVVRKLARKGNPGCLRLEFFVDNILPLLETLRQGKAAEDEDFEDEDDYGYED